MTATQGEVHASRPSSASLLALAASVVVYCVTVSLIPLYTKVAFSGGLGVPKFKYPITAAWLQLGFGSLCLILFAMIMRPLGLSPGSWLLGPHFWFKVYYIFPTGFAFGIKYAVTNWAIQTISSGTHVVLGATDLIWILLLARIINKEKMGVYEFLSIVVCFIGIIIVTDHKVKTIEGAAFLPIFANLLAPFIGAFCVTTLRAGVVGLFDKSNRLQGTTTKIEFTAIKLSISTLAAFLSSMIFENGVVHITNTEAKLPDAWWVALSNYSFEGTALICATGILTFIFHVNLAWLCEMTSATAVGLMQEVKVLPQYALNSIFSAMGVAGLTVDTSFVNLFGAALGLLGSVLYAGASYISHTQGKLLLGRNGFYRVFDGEEIKTPETEVSLQDGDPMRFGGA